ncbi:heme biosynthesis protein HemY [Consotaella aegiceratis]|uniref:heme biosynthesis protein HemY n=1 Tax=Consotaella aegiceratis TaxID=3097961 RepID=UPI002F428084
MLRILTFFLVVLAAGLGFAWLADNPGDVALTWQGQHVETSFLVFIIVELLLIAAVLVVVWLVLAFLRTPGAVSGFFRRRRRDRGYSALSSGILAAGAGDAALARRMSKRSEKLLGNRREPLVRFLDAQTAMIEGDHQRAHAVFETMEREPETRLLALRGLYLEAERRGDEAAARHYAERAARIAPHVPWAGGAVLEAKSIEGDWDGALAIQEAQQDSRMIGSDEAKRLRAVLLTAKAMAVADADPTTAKNAAIEAHKLAPDLTPAAVTAARALIRLGDLKRGAKILERAWTANPHPEIADAYVHARLGDSTSERLKRAKTLQSLRPNHVEASLAVAHAALDAQDFALAREEAMAAARMEPRESVFLLLADIEEADGGNEGRMREWLARAVRAPRDPAWTADGVVADEWAPISPVTGRLDAFEWKVPVQRLGGDAAVEIDDLGEPGALVEHEPAAPALVAEEDETAVDADAEIVEAPASPQVNGGNGGDDTVVADDKPAQADVAAASAMPDDPGVSRRREPAEDGEQNGRFRLF